MKKTFIAQSVLLLGVLPLLAALPGETDIIWLGNYEVHPNRVLVKVKPGVSQPEQQAVLQSQGLQMRREFELVPRLKVLELSSPNPNAPATQRAEALAQRLEALRLSGQFEYVQPDYIKRPALQPNDARFLDGTLWGLRNDGGSGGVAGADIDAERAWDITTGSTNVIVAVIDTGVRYTHQDLAAQMWRNPGESGGGKETNGIDDDGNGYVDDVFGINAVANNGNPMDVHDHGTHVSGTIGAAANNGAPHVGVAWRVRIMALKFLNPSGATSDAIECLQYAVKKGAKISNNSWGGGPYEQSLFDAIVAARNAGHLFIASAGNNASNNDAVPAYPANYNVDNVISVAALDRADRLANFSNYGLTKVHLGAPGVQIYSSTSGSDVEYQFFQGTSMAAPHVTGVAALMLARFPQASYFELRDGLLQTVVPVAALNGKCTTGGRVNAYQALSAEPDGVLEVAVTPPSGSVLLAPSTNIINVRVADRFGITNATVAASVTNNGSFYTNLTFINTGVAPDTGTNDSIYTAVLRIPSSSTSVVMVVTATAPGKTGTTALVNYTVVTFPDNDNFAAAKKIPAGGGLMLSTTRFATMEAGEPSHAGVPTVNHSLWYNWSTAADGPVLLDTAGSAFDTVLAVYTGNNLLSLTPIASVDDVGNLRQAYVSFNAAAGVTYRIAVASQITGDVGALRLRAELNGLPDTNAPVVSIVSPTNGFVSPTNFITVSGTAYDPTPNASGISEVSVVLNNGVGQIAFGTTNWSASLVLPVGDSIIQVSARDFSGNWSTPRAVAVVYTPLQPVNDHFVNASLLSLATNRVIVDTTSATKEYGEPNHAFNQGGKSVWWKFVPAEDGLLSLTTAGSGFDTLLGLYQGDYVNELTTVANNDDANPDVSYSALTQAVRGGQTYRFAVDGYAGASGHTELGYTFTATPVFDLEVTSGVGGTASPASGIYASNAQVSVTAVPAAGFVFGGWSGSLASAANPLVFNILTNVTLTANFLPRVITDDFETGDFSASQAWNLIGPAGNLPWIVQSNTAAGGLWSARSSTNIADSQTSALSLTVYTSSGNGSFDFKVSSELNWDFFEFYVDGLRLDRWSGEQDWISYVFPLASGLHTLEWRYVKDVYGKAGLDAAFIDNLNLPTVEPSFKLVNVGWGSFTVEVTGAPNQLFYIQGSTNLVHWETLSTNYWNGSPMPYADPEAPGKARRYYRAYGPR